MCDGTTSEAFDIILREHEQWKAEEYARREAEEALVQSETERWEATCWEGSVPRETHVDVEATISVQQSLTVHQHAPLQASAILAILAVVVALFLGYLLWPYRGVIVAVLLVLFSLAAVLFLLRLAWPVVEQIRAGRAERQQLLAPLPHDDVFLDDRRRKPEQILIRR